MTGLTSAEQLLILHRISEAHGVAMKPLIDNWAAALAEVEDNRARLAHPAGRHLRVVES